MKTKLPNLAFIIFLFSLLIPSFSKAQWAKIMDLTGPLNGAIPSGHLMYDGTFLYGMSASGGTISGCGGFGQCGSLYKIKPDGTSFAKLLDFSPATIGSRPYGSLISDGTFLYGMTSLGGTGGGGTVFKIKPDGTSLLKIFDFNFTNGSNPQGALFYDGTFLYGTTQSGGVNSSGVIFKIKPDGTGFVKLLDFVAVTNGSMLNGALISDGTYLYGTASAGGTNNYGTVFKIKTDGTGFLNMHNFTDSPDGSSPNGTLFSDGTFFYGLCSAGGTSSVGTIFKIKPDGTGYATLFNFSGASTGNSPIDALISDGTFLYGTTTFGGLTNNGTIYKIKPDGTGYSNLYDFTGMPNGSAPSGALVSAGNSLYGVTASGGVNDIGSIYKYGLVAGVHENILDIDLSLYPNPTNGKITLKINRIGNSKIAGVEVYNLLGEKISLIPGTEIDPSSKYEIDLSGNIDGIYFLNLKTEKEVIVKKILLQK